jgi:hypothetical protein
VLRILLIYYSQSGEVHRVAEVLAESLKRPEVELTIEVLRPQKSYPFPWQKIGNFFDVLPECHWGPLPNLCPLGFDAGKKFDLVILVYQVWFLAPSLPVQAFLRSNGARVLKDTKVLTVSVSRRMWQSASETMKQSLRERGARHIDNIVLTDQGGDWTSLITTPRAMLYGRKEGFWKIFPPVGIDRKKLDRVRHFGLVIVDQQEGLLAPENRPLLGGLEAAPVEMRPLLAERVGWHCFRAWGSLILALGKRGANFRRAGVYAFVVFLVCSIPIVIPATMLIRIVLWPIIGTRMNAYARRLREPSERTGPL